MLSVYWSDAMFSQELGGNDSLVGAADAGPGIPGATEARGDSFEPSLVKSTTSASISR
jgi:hypothetical protein